MIYSSYQVRQTTLQKSFHFLCTYPRKVFSARGRVSTIPWPSTEPIMAPGGRDLGDFLSFCAGLVIYSSYQVQQTTCLKTFHFLCTYARKVFSAWAEVWSISWPSTEPIMAPGGRDLGDF